MGQKLPRITGKEALRALERGRWYRVRQKGSHVILKHQEKLGARVTIPTHSGEILLPKTLKNILDQGELTVEEFINLL